MNNLTNESQDTQPLDSFPSLTPKQVVQELDRFVISQHEAKRAVAIALRNRWRRLRAPEGLKEEITPKNILMIGPTGVGKTEISRRLAKLAQSPFVKVEASKFTEVGYVGRDVESIVRDLVETAVTIVREEARKRVIQQAKQVAEERILDILLPNSASLHSASHPTGGTASDEGEEGRRSTREKLRELLLAKNLDERVIEIETTKQVSTHLEIVGPHGMGEVEGHLKEMFSNMIPKAKEKKKLPIKEAREILIAEAQESLVDPEQISRLAVKRAEESGIVFIDEIDKICGGGNAQKGPDVSREGVQRDLLPLVEGCTVSTKHGAVRTDHVLFIASGAFHHSKPSDLMPEFQGRFPIRVELKSLNAEHFVRILTEPHNALTKQYRALMATENVQLEFTEDGVAELARLTAEVNSRTEDIGARRLHTLLEKVLEEISFAADEQAGQAITIDARYVQERLGEIVKDEDLSRFIL